MTSNVIQLPLQQHIQELSALELDSVEGGARVSNAALAAGAAVWSVWVGAFTVGVSIGKDIGEAIFGEDKD